MKRSSWPRRKASNLSESIHQQLNRYALAAGAAGVSVLAFAQSSEAKIVYTPADVHFSAPQQYSLDLNHDGITDFTIYDTQHRSQCHSDGAGAFLFVRQPQANGAVNGGVQHFAPYTAALDRKETIGPKQSFLSGSEEFMAEALRGRWGRDCGRFSFIVGPWANVTNRYLGLKFMIKGKTHYGWARISVQAGFVYVYATLTGYAYETIAGKSINAGQKNEATDDSTNENFGRGASVTSPIPDTLKPATLGALAMGAPGLSIWRRKESILEGGLKVA